MLDLRDNINLWGSPPAARRVLRSLRVTRVAAYPSVGAAPLAALLAARIGVQPDEVIIGCGSDDVIDASFRGLATRGARLAFCEPTFSMVPVFARANGLRPVAVASLPSGAADVDALLATRADVIYLCSPNNPTGVVTPAAEIHRLIAGASGVVLVDEAYAEFAGLPDWRSTAPAMGNVLVTRTFSKAWGLAGLRVGYGIGARALVTKVARARGPYQVNVVAELAALAAFRDDRSWQERTSAAAITARQRLAERLHRITAGRGVRAWPSAGNFLLVPVRPPAPAVADRFAARGFGVRAFSDLPGIGDAIRIGVAPWSRLRRVADVAEELLA